MTSFNNKIVWITGASSGIGAALAKAFAAQGAHIILSGRRVSALQEVADEIATGKTADTLVLPFEVTQYDALAGFVEQAWAWKGRVDILVNNAGISQRSLAVHTSPQVYTDLLNVDLIAPIWLTQLQLPHMVQAGGGHIVAISSLAGRFGAPLRTAYCAAKHGLIGYMDALRSEVALPHNINVTNVLPGSVATQVAQNALTGDGSSNAKAEDNIDNGDDPMDCAVAILDAVHNNVPELVYAKGMELELAKLRHSDPDATFNALAQLGLQTVQNYT